jgi:hypothetical protein
MWSDAHDLPRRGPLIPSLQALAYAMQERFGGSDGKQVMVTLDEALAHLNHARAEDLLKAGTQLAVLDEERKTDQVRFFHQLLQEYFAARQLAAQPAPAAELARSEWRADRIKPSLADKLATLQDFEPLPPPDPTGWEETTMLAASMAADPDAFVRALAEGQPGTGRPLRGRPARDESRKARTVERCSRPACWSAAATRKPICARASPPAGHWAIWATRASSAAADRTATICGRRWWPSKPRRIASAATRGCTPTKRRPTT